MALKAWQRQTAAACECVGIFVCGTLLARLIARAVGLPTRGLRDLQPSASVDFLSLAWVTGANLLVRYGLILTLAFAVGWWYRRWPLREYGVTTSRLPVKQLIAIALLVFSVGGAIPKFLLFIGAYVPLGSAPRHWELSQSTGSIDFWIYMAVSSYFLVPILEELFARGYLQTRLGEDFGAPAAVLMTAALFTASHRQYFIVSFIGLAMLASLLFASLLVGYVRYRFGTVLPGMLAHALGNVPVRGTALLLLIFGMLGIILLGHRVIAEHLRQMFQLISCRSAVQGAAAMVLLVLVVVSIASTSPIALAALGVGALLVAIVIEVKGRREIETETPTGSGTS